MKVAFGTDEKTELTESLQLTSDGVLEVNLDSAHMIAHVFRGELPQSYTGLRLTIDELLANPQLMPGLDVLTSYR